MSSFSLCGFLHIASLPLSQMGQHFLDLINHRDLFMQAYISTFEKLKTENQQNELSRTFSFPKLPLQSWILHCFCKNFPEYSHNTTIRISILVYSSPRHFSWFKNHKLHWFSNSHLALSFACTKTFRALVDTNLLLMMNIVAERNACI